MLVRLRDGSRVEIRPIEPDDRAALADGFERLGPESRYRRFFGPMPQLRESDLDFLTSVDHHDHEAVVAVDPETGDGVGVARYVRTGSDVAEPAMAVVDDWQRRGVGSHLLEALVDRARSEGVSRFEAPVLATNDHAIHVLERLGRTRIRHEGREAHLTILLPPAQRGAPDWAAILRQFATGALEPARTVLARLWPRRAGEPGDERRNVIVVGTDGSEHAVAAIETTAALADATEAAIEVVGAHRFLLPEQPPVEEAVTAAARMLRDRGLHVHEHLRRGDPALAITDVAEEQNARMIVVGAGERGKLARRVLGSVANSVAEQSPCDVLIVRPQA